MKTSKFTEAQKALILKQGGAIHSCLCPSPGPENALKA